MAPVPFDAEQSLVRHGTALRALAHELVRGRADASADDVVQETWLRAMRRPPVDGGTSGWFATVLKNVVRRSRRDHVRRVRREDAVARSAVVEDSAEAAQRTETTRRLLAAIDTLDAATRDVVWRRFFEGQPPREIAAARNEPVATVKSRLQRGIRDLREQLGKDGGGEWCAAFAAAFGLGKKSAAAAALAGGVVMTTWMKVAAALVVIAGAWLVWPESWSAEPASTASLDRSADAPTIAAAATANGNVPAAPSADPVREIAVDSDIATAGSSRVAVSTAADATPPRGIMVRGRVVDRHGAPVAGMQVDVNHAASTDGQEEGRYRAAATQDDGSFAFVGELLPGKYEPRVKPACEVVEPTTIELSLARPVVDLLVVVDVPPGIRGRVIDERGEPVRAVVTLDSEPDEIRRMRSMVNSRPDGSFFVPKASKAATGPVRLAATAAGFERCTSPPIEWGTEGVELRLRRSVGLVVCVLDRDGAPVRDFDVLCVPTSGPQGFARAVTGPAGPFADGTATITNVRSGSWMVCVAFPDAPSLTLREVADVPATGRTITLTTDAVATRVRVLDAEGRPVANSTVEWCELFGATFAKRSHVMRAEIWRGNAKTDYGVVVADGLTDGNGEFVVPLQRGRTFGLRVMGAGHVAWLRDAIVADDRDVVVTVRRGARLVGRVRPANALDLLRRYESEAPKSWERVPIGVRQVVPLQGPRQLDKVNLREIAVAADGSFVVAGLAPGNSRLEVEYPVVSGAGSGWVSVRETVDLGIVALRDGEDMRLDIDLAAVIPGDLVAHVVRNGVSFADARCQLDGPLAEDGGMAPSFSVRTDDTGAIRAVLKPGRYRVALRRMQGHEITAEILAPEIATVVAAATTETTFTFAIGTLAVRVVDADGVAVRGAVVECRAGERRALLLPTDASGRATVDLSLGVHTMRVARTADGAAKNEWTDAGEVVVEAARAAERTLLLPTGSAPR